MQCACSHPSICRYSLHLPTEGWPGWVCRYSLPICQNVRTQVLLLLLLTFIWREFEKCSKSATNQHVNHYTKLPTNAVPMITMFAVSCSSESTRRCLGMLMNSRSNWLSLDWSVAEHYRHAINQWRKHLWAGVHAKGRHFKHSLQAVGLSVHLQNALTNVLSGAYNAPASRHFPWRRFTISLGAEEQPYNWINCQPKWQKS